jgi:hypothetical protein
MNAIRIRTQLSSTTLSLPELSNLVGRSIEIIVFEDVEGSRRAMVESLQSSPQSTELFDESLMEVVARLA